jgi:hypothetical protein
MNATSGRQAEIIELHFENEGARVRVVPSDKDLLVLSVSMAVEACRAYANQIRFNDQHDMLLSRLWGWINQHLDKVGNAFITSRDDGMLFLVVLREKRFDKEIEDELTQLDIDVANDRDFDLIRLSVHAVPDCSEDEYRSFLSKWAIRFPVDVERSGPH